MHEESLVRSLLAQVEQLRVEHAAEAITCVTVEVGPLSGVEPLLVREAFKRLIVGTPQADMKLVIREVPLTCLCRACGAESRLDSFHFQCPDCGSSSVQITTGDEFRLIDITVETEDPVGATP